MHIPYKGMLHPAVLSLQQSNAMYTKNTRVAAAFRKESGLEAIIDHLAAAETVRIVGIFHHLDDVLDGLNGNYARILLFDLSMGKSAMSKIAYLHPALNIIVMAGMKNDPATGWAMRNGASGCLHIGAEPDIVLDAVRAVAGARQYIDTVLSSSLYTDQASPVGNVPGSPELSGPELNVLELLSAEYSRRDIALEMNISDESASKYCDELFRKLNADSTANLVRTASRIGLI
jgi:DNA-binding NarL/FixJ family response regulator